MTVDAKDERVISQVEMTTPRERADTTLQVKTILLPMVSLPCSSMIPTKCGPWTCPAVLTRKAAQKDIHVHSGN